MRGGEIGGIRVEVFCYPVAVFINARPAVVRSKPYIQSAVDTTRRSSLTGEKAMIDQRIMASQFIALNRVEWGHIPSF